jgi:hypothetical protein
MGITSLYKTQISRINKNMKQGYLASHSAIKKTKHGQEESLGESQLLV